MWGNSRRRLPGGGGLCWGDSDRSCQLTTVLRKSDSAFTSQWEAAWGRVVGGLGGRECSGDAVGGEGKNTDTQRKG